MSVTFYIRQITVLAIRFCALLVFSTGVYASSGGIYDVNGSSGSDCTGCHTGGSFNYTASITSGASSLAPSGDSSYTLSFTRNSGATASGAGFSLTASGGSIDALVNAKAQDSDSITHDGTGNFSWGFDWNAPSTVGTYTLYWCSNPVNLSTDSTGDGPPSCSSHDVVVNSDPSVVSDSPSVNEDSGATTINVLSNDDAGGDGDTLEITGVCASSVGSKASCNSSSYAGTGGTISISGSGADNRLSFTPSADFFGTFNYKYRIEDSFGRTAFGSSSVTVNSQNDDPTAANDLSNSTTEDPASPLTISALSNDSDVEDANTALEITGVCSTATAEASCTASTYSPAEGTISISAASPNNNITYTPASDYNGSFSFRYVITDTGGATDRGRVDVTVSAVNDTPTAVNDSGVSLSEDPASAATINVLSNDLDVEDSVSDFEVVGICSTATLDASCTTTSYSPSEGTFGVTAASPGNQITFMPAANYNGSLTIKYLMEDTGGLRDSATVSITVNAVNDDPVAVDETSSDFSTTEDAANLDIFALNNDTDEEDASTALEIVAVCTSATSDAACTGTSFSSTEGSVSLSATAQNNHIDYVPAADFNGSFTFKYKIEDTGGLSDFGSVTTDVTAQNDDPTAVDDTTFSVGEDSGSNTLDVLANDTDVDISREGDTQQIVALCASSITVIASCTTTSYSDASGSVVLSAAAVDNDALFTPATNYNGAFAFNYVMEDGSGSKSLASVTGTVTAVSDTSPGAVADSIALNEGATATTLVGGASDVKNNDTGLLDTPIVAAIVTSPTYASSFTFNADGTFSYTHDGSENFTDSFDYRLTDLDGETSTATVSISVTPVSDETPVAVNDTMSVNEGGTATSLTTSPTSDANSVLGNDTGLADAPFIMTIQTAPLYASSMTLNNDGTFSYTHDGSENFTDSFVYQLQDNDGQTASATVNISIIRVSDATPVAVADSISLNEGDTAISLVGGANDVTANDTGQLDTPIVISLVTGPSFASSFTFNNDGTFSYTHDGSENHSDSFTYSITDNDSESSQVAVSIAVANVNDPPTAVADTPSAVNEDVVNAVIDVLANDTDPDSGDTQQIVGVCDTSTSDASCNNSSYTDLNGSMIAISSATTGNHLIFNPDANYFGSFTAKYKMEDGSGVESSATVSFNITAVNDQPVITSSAVTSAVRTEAYSYNVTVDDPDDPNDGSGALTFGISSVPVVSGLSISNMGAITWTPGETDPSGNSVAVTVTVDDDGADGTVQAVQNYTITVDIPDMDSDSVADYDDNCPNDSNSDQANNDSDSEGDVCDADDDNDGITDDFENNNGLDPFDASDAALDPDGDGVTNLEEFTNNTDPNADDYPPVVTVDSSEVTVDAEGVVTFVTLTATGNDAKDGSVATTCTIFKTDLGVAGDDCTGGYAFGTGRQEIRWSATDSSGNTSSDIIAVNGGANDVVTSQYLNVVPQVMVDPSQSIGEGMTAALDFTLNGEAAAYPVVINYTVSGTSDASDHDAVSSSISIASGTSASLNINVVGDLLLESDETIVFTLTSATNATLSDNVVHTVTITETNLPPEVDLTVTQNSVNSFNVYTDDGSVQFNANATDPNTGTAGLLYSWSAGDLTLSSTSISNPSIADISGEAAGVYPITVTVQDPSGLSTTSTIYLVINSGNAPTLSAASDSDNDGVSDDIEGLDDDDNDGLANYLDPIDQGNLLNVDVDANQNNLLKLIETEVGLRVSLGEISSDTANVGALITADDVTNSSGIVVDAAYSIVGGLFDFVISDLNPGDSARIVIPLTNGVPANAIYRKYNSTDGWFTFVEDANNSIESAYSVNGSCPGVASTGTYQSGLLLLADCIRLTLSDGGPNDADKTADGRIVDPGGIAIQTGDSGDNVSSGATSSSKFSWIYIAILALCFIVTRRRDIR